MVEAPWSKYADRSGRFERKQSEFRAQIGDPEFPAEPGRYHLLVSHACPWAHRTMMARSLLGLQKSISVDVVDWLMNGDGSWSFRPEKAGSTACRVLDTTELQDVYFAMAPEFPSIGTVPILWDKKQGIIVSNESREILRMFNEHAEALGGHDESLSPPELRADIDAMIDANYETINNGVYKCGFARTQEAYEEAMGPLFERLDALEDHLENRDFLVGEGKGQFTEADICLWTTLIRFDPVYHTHFKTNRKLIAQYPNLLAFTKRVAHIPKVWETVDLEHIVAHYYASHESINPFRIVPWHNVDVQLDLMDQNQRNASVVLA